MLNLNFLNLLRKILNRNVTVPLNCCCMRAFFVTVGLPRIQHHVSNQILITVLYESKSEFFLFTLFDGIKPSVYAVYAALAES